MRRVDDRSVYCKRAGAATIATNIVAIGDFMGVPLLAPHSPAKSSVSPMDFR